MKLASFSLALALLVFTEGCRKPGPVPQDSTLRGVPRIYAPLFEGGRLRGDAELEAPDGLEHFRSRFPIETITLQRSPCFGRCPVYRFSMNRNGRAELEAIKNMPTLGNFSGEVDAWDYGRLCYLLEQLHFLSFAPAYEGAWTDDATCTITTTGKDHEKTVSDYGSIGSIELWTIQQTIDNIRHKIVWKPR
jgi:hypothetical protein